MNKQARVNALRQTIMHTIKGEHELAEALFKSVATASCRRIVMGESNYSIDGDDDFDARRELQRELEDDLAAGDVAGGDVGADGAGGDLDGSLDSEDGGDADIIDAIVAKLEGGEVDDDALAQILSLLVGEEGGEEGPEGFGGEEGGELEVDPAAGGDAGDVAGLEFDDLEDPTKLESAGGTLISKIKFALGYDYDQFLDAGGEPGEWDDFALVEPSEHLQALLDQIPADLKTKYDAAIKQIIADQAK